MPFKVETCLRNKKFFSLLENINLAPKIVFRYVDDIKLLRAIKLGWRWENVKMRPGRGRRRRST